MNEHITSPDYQFYWRNRVNTHIYYLYIHKCILVIKKADEISTKTFWQLFNFVKINYTKQNRKLRDKKIEIYTKNRVIKTEWNRERETWKRANNFHEFISTTVTMQINFKKHGNQTHILLFLSSSFLLLFTFRVVIIVSFVVVVVIFALIPWLLLQIPHTNIKQYTQVFERHKNIVLVVVPFPFRFTNCVAQIKWRNTENYLCVCNIFMVYVRIYNVQR